MDFNTGSGGTEGPGSSGRTDAGYSRASGGGGGEFTLADPVGSFTDAARRVLLEANDFFRGLARRGDWVGPIVFALVCYEIYAVLAGIIGLVFGGIASFGAGGAGEPVAGVATSLGGFVLGVVLAPIFAVIILLVMAGLRHLLVIFVVGAGNAGFEATMRVQAYTFATRLFWWIPIIGAIAGFFYGLYLSVVGIREVHATTTGKAAVVVLVPVAIMLLVLALLAAVVGALIFTLLQQQV